MMNEEQSEVLEWLQKNNLSGATCQQQAVYEWKDTGIPLGSSKLYTDFKQGSCNDCFFVAALMSATYRASAKLRATHPNYKFFNTGLRPTPNWEDVSTNSILALDNQTSSLMKDRIVYAKPNNVDKVWASLYEKAYAKWLAKTNSDQPSYSNLCGGGGLSALLHILGGVWDGTKFTNLVTNPDPTKIPIIAGNVTQYPTVAKTKSGAGAGLTSLHTYSVLQRTTTGLKLRNPCGAVDKDVTFQEFTGNFTEWGYVIPP